MNKVFKTVMPDFDMTENEAIEVIKKADEQSVIAINKMLSIEDDVRKTEKFGEYYSVLDNCLKERAACAVAINALKEVQQYRALESKLNGISVEQVVNAFISTLEKGFQENYECGRILTNEDADMWDAYRTLGTVEECRNAIEISNHTQ